jgi:hypothetical protein
MQWQIMALVLHQETQLLPHALNEMVKEARTLLKHYTALNSLLKCVKVLAEGRASVALWSAVLVGCSIAF